MHDLNGYVANPLRLSQCVTKHLSDSSSDGFLDREEVEAIYGVHHVYSQKLSKDEKEQQEKADNIADTVLGIMDKNSDGKISQAEFVAAGVDSLPTFEGLEGHHYDVESGAYIVLCCAWTLG